MFRIAHEFGHSENAKHKPELIQERRCAVLNTTYSASRLVEAVLNMIESSAQFSESLLNFMGPLHTDGCMRNRS
jgi:hypothetical protein